MSMQISSISPQKHVVDQL